MGTVEASLVEFVTYDRFWQGLQKDQQDLGYRVVTTSYRNS